jgi:DNA-binding beta-propeller fold protein YncE
MVRRRAMQAVAAAAAAAAVISAAVPARGGTPGSHAPRVAAGASLVHPVIAYVAASVSGTVTPIRTATNTALPPVKVGVGANAIAITPDGKTAYVAIAPNARQQGTVVPVRTATNRALRPLTCGPSPRLPSARGAMRHC